MANNNLEKYLEAILDQIADGTETDIPRPSWNIEKYLAAIYEALIAKDPADPEVVEEFVNAWLDDHPEATTTVEDGAVTEAKLASDAVTTAKIADGAITDAKLAASGVKSDVADLKSVFDSFNGLRFLTIDVTAFTSGKYVWSDGKAYNNANYSISPFLRCAFKKIKFNCLTKGGGIQNVAFYSDNNESSFISGYENSAGLDTYPTHEMDVPSNTKYIRVTRNTTNTYVGNIVPYVYSTETWEAASERIDAIKGTADEALYKVEHIDASEVLSDVYRTVVDDTNLVDNTAYTAHTYVKNDGTISTTSNPSASAYPFCLSDYIPVIEGKTVYLNDKFLTGQYYAFYTENKTYLGGKTEYGVWYTHNHVCSKTVPSTAAYLRVTSSTEADAQALWASYTGAVPTGDVIKASDEEYVDYHYYPTNPCDYNGEEISVFNKIVCIGDSITSGYFNAASDSQSIAKYAYPAFLQKLTGVECTNKGDAGETSVSWWAAHSSDDFSGYDCAIINLGINDVLTSVSEADTRSAFASIISALKTANTGIKIFIADVVPAYSRGNTTYDAINAILEDIATTTENCYFVDLTQYGHAVGVAYADGHLTACGYLRLAQDYKAAIGWIIKNDPVGFRYVQFIGTNLQPAT